MLSWLIGNSLLIKENYPWYVLKNGWHNALRLYNVALQDEKLSYALLSTDIGIQNALGLILVMTSRNGYQNSHLVPQNKR